MTLSVGGQSLVSWASRGFGYLGLWVTLIGFDSADLVVGVIAAAVAAWVSLYLLPPNAFRLRLAGLPRYALRFACQSVFAGLEVARQALVPRQSLLPGMVSYPSHYPRGARRNAFAALTSLLPGTLAVGDEPEGVVYHCLDRRQPLIEQLAEEERALLRVLPREPEP